jgi:FkbM family methyltransferase
MLPDMLLEHIGFIDDGFFVEVGAFDGLLWSNTSGLADLGWGGLLFEPQTEAWKKCVDRYANNSKVTVVRKAVSNFKGHTQLYLGGSVSTIHKETKELYLGLPAFQSTGLGRNKKERVEVARLDDELIRLGATIDFELLVIDVEGSEWDVLCGFTIDLWRPKMVVIEAHEQHNDSRLRTRAGDINEYMRLAGYRKIYSDAINNIYVYGGK